MPTLEPMRILDYELAGRKVVEWAKDSSTRPVDMAEFRQQLAGLVDIPERYTSLEIVQGDDHHFVLRLPPKNQVTESESTIADEVAEGTAYEYPEFYNDLIDGSGLVDNLTFFYSRISDYTIRGCR